MTKSEHIPKSVWQGTFQMFGVDVRCHVLDNGQRIIETESMEALFEAMATADVDTVDIGDIEAFARWKAQRRMPPSETR